MPLSSGIIIIVVSLLYRLTIKYFGKASHAAADPWNGINALDAAVLCYTNISCLRQQLKPSWRIHGATLTALDAIST